MSCELFSEIVREAAAEFANSAASLLDLELQEAGLSIAENHGIAWRVKSEQAIRAKLARNQAINDFIGIRVLATHVGMLEPIVNALQTWEITACLRRLRTDTRFDDRDESGLRSFHLDYELVDTDLGRPPSGITIELQVTTWLQHLHGFLGHQLCDKSLPGRGVVAPVLRDLSDRLVILDQDIAEAVSALERR